MKPTNSSEAAENVSNSKCKIIIYIDKSNNVGKMVLGYPKA